MAEIPIKKNSAGIKQNQGGDNLGKDEKKCIGSAEGFASNLFAMYGEMRAATYDSHRGNGALADQSFGHIMYWVEEYLRAASGIWNGRERAYFQNNEANVAEAQRMLSRFALAELPQHLTSELWRAVFSTLPCGNLVLVRAGELGPTPCLEALGVTPGQVAAQAHASDSSRGCGACALPTGTCCMLGAPGHSSVSLPLVIHLRILSHFQGGIDSRNKTGLVRGPPARGDRRHGWEAADAECHYLDTQIGATMASRDIYTPVEVQYLHHRMQQRAIEDAQVAEATLLVSPTAIRAIDAGAFPPQHKATVSVVAPPRGMPVAVSSSIMGRRPSACSSTDDECQPANEGDQDVAILLLSMNRASQ